MNQKSTVVKGTQDRAIFYPTPTTTFHHTLKLTPNAISLNREGTQCVIGGRNLLKIFSIEERGFVERVNLVVGPKKLNYSITDVQWHPLEENIIASAAGNGAVILWDLNKVNEMKQEHVFQQHMRFVNKLCFHPTEASLLMSCSQDGNMNCFDIRHKEVSATFHGKTEGIRDVQFHPSFDKNIFCAACESGNVQLWDLRKPDHYYSQFTAHTGGPVFTLHWHPEDRYWLATGGRDKAIKIWDTQLKNHPTHVLQTIAALNKIKWRPGHRYHIASCAMNLDNNVNIWDIRRPYVPLAAFEVHKDVATGLIWQSNPDIILSCSKDKTIYHHVIQDAERPAEKAPPVALSLSPSGMIANAYSPKRVQNMKANPIMSVNTMYGAAVKKLPSEFKPEESVLKTESVNDILDETLIKSLAENYIFHGKPFVTICDHNAAIAKRFELHDKVQTWLILRQLYANETVHLENADSKFPLPSPVTSVQHATNDVFARQLDTPESFTDNILLNDSDDSDENQCTPDFHTPSGGILSNAQYNMTIGPELDAVFGDEVCNLQFLSSDICNEEDEEDALPSEAIQLRQSFGDKAVVHKDTTEDIEEVQQQKESGVLPITGLMLPPWDFGNLVRNMLYHYVELGDLQMSVTVLLALDDVGKRMIDFDTQEEWFSGYLDILYRLYLFNIATEVINHAPPPVNSLNQNSTTVHMRCGNCSKVMAGITPGWYCKSCKQASQVCSICHIPVKGLYVWCQGCGHGGHLLHVKEWFERRKTCPAGCGHKCEYS